MISNDSSTNLILQALRAYSRIFPETESEWEEVKRKIEQMTSEEQEELKLSEGLATLLDRLTDNEEKEYSEKESEAGEFNSGQGGSERGLQGAS